MIAGNRLPKSRVFDKHGGRRESTERLQRYLPTVPRSKCCCAKQIGFSMSEKEKDKIALVPPREHACLWRKSFLEATFQAMTAAH
jgi:hypothetical protein